MSVSFHERLVSLGIPHLDDFGPGTHTWPYWERDLTEALPSVMKTFADARRPAARAGREHGSRPASTMRAGEHAGRSTAGRGHTPRTLQMRSVAKLIGSVRLSRIEQRRADRADRRRWARACERRPRGGEVALARHGTPAADITQMTGDAFVDRAVAHHAFGPDRTVLEVGLGYGRILRMSRAIGSIPAGWAWPLAG